MAQGSRDDIRQRISLDGGEDVKRQLDEIGRSGEKAFDTLDRAARDSNSMLGRISDGVQRVGRGFQSAASATTPIREGFSELSSKAGEFQHTLTEVAERTIPHFHEVLALATGASIAGFAAFVLHAAAAADEIGKTSDRLGISVDAFQRLSRAAVLGGVNTEEFTRAMQRFGQEAAQAAAQAQAAIASTARDLFGAIPLNEASIIARGADQVQSVFAEVVRGGRAATAATQDAAQQITRGFVSIGRVSDESSKKISEFANLMQSELKEAGITIPFDRILRAVTQTATGIGSESEKLRKTLRGFGADLPPQNIAEALDRLQDTWTTKLGALVPVVEVVKGKVRQRKLDEIFLDLADRIQHMQDPSRELAVIAGTLGERLGPKFRQLLLEGRHGIEEVAEALTKAGVVFTVTDTKVGQNLVDSFEHLETSMHNVANLSALVFAPVLQPLIEAITKAIEDNAGAIRQWAQGIAERAKPIVEDLIAILQGANQNVKTDWVKNLIGVFNTFSAVAQGLATVASAIIAPIQLLTTAVNSVFGTDFNASAIAAVAVVGQLTGVWTLLAAGVALADAAISALVTGPLALLITALGPVVLIPIVAAVIASFVDWGTAIDNLRRTAEAFWEMLKAIAGWMTSIFFGILDFLKNKVADVANALSNLASVGGGQIDIPSAQPAGFAAGGLVPGSGRGDHIRALLEPGEFVMRRSIVDSLGARFFADLNGGMGSLMPGRTGFGTGGIVTAGVSASTRAPVHLHIGDETFAMETDDATAQRVMRVARRKATTSAGRAPGWAS